MRYRASIRGFTVCGTVGYHQFGHVIKFFVFHLDLENGSEAHLFSLLRLLRSYSLAIVNEHLVY